MLELVPNAEQILTTDSSQSAKRISALVGVGCSGYRECGNDWWVGWTLFFFSWYPQICFQKLVQVS